jgi:hypothetical protein
LNVNAVLRANNATSSLTAPLLMWSIVQLIALLASAARVKLWATFPTAGESLALIELLITQLIASSLVFPLLCRTRQSMLAILLTSLPAFAFAGFLAQANWTTVLACFAFLALWLIGLTGWREVVRTERAQLRAISIVSALVIGGAVVVYLAREFGNAASPLSRASPMFETAHMSIQPDFQAFFVVSCMAISGVAASVISRVKLSTGVIP